MKTIQELYNEVMDSRELKARFIEAANADRLEAFLKEHGCEATPEEVGAFLKAKSEEDGPLSLNELENSAGGKCNDKTFKETMWSIATVGTYCAFMTIVSTAKSNRHVGQQNENEGRLCSSGQ